MPQLEVCDLLDDSVYWPPAGFADDGVVSVGAAVAVKTRWIIQATEIIGPEGTPIKIDATVLVDQAVVIQGVLREGALADLPNIPNNLYEIVHTKVTKDIKSRNTRYRASCIRRPIPI